MEKDSGLGTFCPSITSVRHPPDARVYIDALHPRSSDLLFQDCSSPSRIDEDGGHDPLSLTLFDARNVTATHLQTRVDVVSFAGGPVWALDWCPCGSADVQYVAVGAHSRTTPHQCIGQAIRGPGLIQLWRLTSNAPVDITMCLGICHDEGVVRALRWCPHAWEPLEEGAEESTADRLPRLGLLSAALGDGSLVVYAVPHAEILAQRFSSMDDGDYRARLWHLDTIFHSREMTHHPVAIEWSMQNGQVTLIAGCHDGIVLLFDLVEGAGMPRLAIQAHESVITRVICSTEDPNLLITASHDSSLRLWNVHDPLHPLACSTLVKRGWVLDALWPPFFPAILFCLDDGSVRHWDPVQDNQRCEKYHDGAVWACSLSQFNHLATCGMDGTVIMRPLSLNSCKTRRKRCPVEPLILSYTWSEPSPSLCPDCVPPLKMSLNPFLGRPSPTYPNTHKGSRGLAQVLPSTSAAMHRVQWNPNPKQASWIIMGGAGGYTALDETRER